MITVKRGNNIRIVKINNLRDGDIVLDGVLADGAGEPVAVAPQVQRLILKNGNFDNVLLNQEVTVYDEAGVAHIYPAAPHTSGWVLRTSEPHYFFASSVNRNKEKDDQYFDYVYESFNETFDDVKKLINLSKKKLKKLQNLFIDKKQKDPDGAGKVYDVVTVIQEDDNG
jgi:hypothetical protein